MGIDERWEIEDDPEWRVLEPPPGGKTFRWILAIGLTALIGIGLAAILSPVSRTGSGATPEAMPVEAIIQQEAQALASGDRDAFLALQDSRDVRWYESQRALFEAWDTPPLDADPFEVIETGSLGDDRAWADVRQLRGFGYVRETRFYRLEDDAWRRTRPDPSFWGRQRVLETVHFRVLFAEGDEELVQYAVARFEAAYARLCVDLGCEIRPEYSHQYGNDPIWYSQYPIWYSPFPRVLTMTLILRPDIDRSTWETIDRGQSVTILAPSPRVLGVVDRWLGQIDPLDPLIYDSLVMPAARVAAGGAKRWTDRAEGRLFFDAVVKWERDWLRPLTSASLRYAPPPTDFFGEDMPRLAALWDWPDEISIDGSEPSGVQDQAMSAVVFIARRFRAGNLARFMQALGPAGSLPEAIESGLDVPYEQFERRWREWLEQLDADLGRGDAGIDLSSLNLGTGRDEVVPRAGVEGRDVSPGSRLLTYELGDGSRVFVGFALLDRLQQVTVAGSNGDGDEVDATEGE